MEYFEETLNLQQRQKRALILRRYLKKIERAREIAKNKLANDNNIRKRAFAQARQIVRKRFAGERGAEYEKLGPSEKIAIDKIVDKKQKLIKKIALRLIPKVKQMEQKRLQAFFQGKNLINLGKEDDKRSINEEILSIFEEIEEKKKQKLKIEINNPNRSKKYIIQHEKFSEENYGQIYKSLIKKSENNLIPIDTLIEVYNRGINSWNNSIKSSEQQYAFARVNSFINKGKTYFNEDYDLVEILGKDNEIGRSDLVKKYKSETPGQQETKEEINVHTLSADRKVEYYTDPVTGKRKIRLVRSNRDIVK